MFCEKRSEGGEGGGSVSVYCSSLEKFVQVGCVYVCVRARGGGDVHACCTSLVCTSLCAVFKSVVCVRRWFAFVPGPRFLSSSGLRQQRGAPGRAGEQLPWSRVLLHPPRAGPEASLEPPPVRSPLAGPPNLSLALGVSPRLLARASRPAFKSRWGQMLLPCLLPPLPPPPPPQPPGRH